MVRDAAALVGFGLVGFGGFLLSPAIGCFVCGGLLILGAVWGHVRNGPSR